MKLSKTRSSTPRPPNISTLATMSSASVEFWKLGKKIAGAGLNYKALCTERKLALPTAPVIFLKPTSSYILEGQTIQIPREFSVNEEVELGVIIGERCKDVSPAQVLDHVAGYCLALDLTATNFLDQARSKGLPWSLGKGFDTACPVSNFIPKTSIPDPDNVQLWCRVNGELKQDANTSDMIFPVAELVSYISRYMTLEPYDLVLTGSSRGVCQIRPGDIVEAGLDNLVRIKFPVEST